MESVKIKKLLDNYFEGRTTLEEEKILEDYFNQPYISEELKSYQPLFMGFSAARQEVFNKKIILPEEKKVKFLNSKIISLAAAVFVGIGVIFLSQPRLTADEKEALEALNQSRVKMMMLSEKLNYGAQKLQCVSAFSDATDRVFNIKE